MKIRYLIIVFPLLAAISCDRDGVFTKEQYKNVFALVSENDNVSRKFHDLEQPESVGYISASMGGTNPTDKEVKIQLVEDPSLIHDFNVASFDVDVSKYYPQMPANKYDLESTTLVIPAGEISGKIFVKIRPEGLSPDSAYFIALRVTSYNTYECNPDKSFILYRVRTKNRYALGDGTTYYSMRGRLTMSGSTIEVPGTKNIAPISKNEVRCMAGNEIYQSNIVTLRKGAFIAEVQSDNKVKIRSYANLDITQIDGDPDYPNVFRVDNDGFKTFKTFLLHYRYTFDNTEKEIREELRYEFNAKSDDTYDWSNY
ncbi:MAG: DUF1735 domain-containing protein [Tannerella sp.]|jgi:hypothetical protein|nr:DUF1735 domain-containing protein [Tannerella sp.]